MTKLVYFLAIVLLMANPSLGQGTNNNEIVPGDNLVVEGIPKIPASLAEAAGRYTRSRWATLSSWHPAKREMLISTQFGDTPQLHYVKFPGGARTQLTFLSDDIVGGSIQPGAGNSLVFRRDTDGDQFYQIYRYDFSTGNAALLTDGHSRNESPVWSNSGELLMYGSNRRNGKDMDLWVMNPVDPKSNRMLLQLEGGFWIPFDWSADDRKALVYQHISSNKTNLWIIDVGTGSRTLLTPQEENENVAHWFGEFSKDGKGVYVTTDRDSEFQRLAYIDLATKHYSFLTDGIHADVDEFDLSPDGNTLAFVANKDGLGRLHLLDTRTRQEKAVPNLPVGVVYGIKWHPKGNELGFGFSSARYPDDIYSIDTQTKKVERWTFSESGGINTDEFKEAEVIRWASFDGRKISGLLYRPPAKFSAVATQISLPEISYLALTEKGKAQEALHQLDLAEQSFLRAVSTIEELRDQVSGSEPDYQKFLQNRVAPYYCMIDLLVNRNRSAEALAYAERVKARVLLDVLREGRVHINRSLTQGEEMKERELHNELVSTSTQLRAEKGREAPDVSHVNDLESRLQRARGAYEEFQTSLYAAHPELKIKRAILPPFTTLDAAAAIPDQRTAVLEYVVADSYTLLFLISRGSGDKVDIKTYRIDITSAALAKQAETFRKILATNLPGYRQPSRDLYTLLIGPASEYLKDKTTLCIVPDGPLWQLPFQALETPEEKFLLERHAIYYAPSLLVLHEMKRKATQLRSLPIGKKQPQDNAELLAVANPATNSEVLAKAHAFTRGDLPPMPETEDEVKQIASESYRLDTTRVLIGTAAREETVKAQISKYHVLHFATHSVLDDRHPLYSYLLLTTDGHSNEDGLLEAWEIMGMDLNAEMAVLSACDTARGRVGAGEGLIGMTWALFVAGVPTTVASQWGVPSNTTTKLMVAFHENVKRVPKAEALRQAALQMMKEPRFRVKPYYWAGFVVVGDGGG